MPDRDGWEIQPRRRTTVLHHDCDRQVTNTRRAKRDHLRVCPARAEAARERRRVERERNQRLREVNRLRAETRA